MAKLNLEQVLEDHIFSIWFKKQVGFVSIQTESSVRVGIKTSLDTYKELLGGGNDFLACFIADMQRNGLPK